MIRIAPMSLILGLILMGCNQHPDEPKTSERSQGIVPILVSKGQRGMKLGSTFYPLGMDAHEFVSRYGRPRKKTNDPLGDNLFYPHDGLVVEVRNDKLHMITAFFSAKSIGNEQISAAKASLDGNFNASSSSAQLLKSYGMPTKTIQPSQNETTYIYPWGFVEFQSGHVSSIALTGGL